MRVAAVGDLHCDKSSQGRLSTLFARARDEADVLLLCGDLTDYGLAEEARILVNEIRQAKSLRILGVLGNHDYESGNPAEIMRILTDGGVQMLDGESVELDGVGFAGVKGFGGGFGERLLQPWGEKINKDFVQEAVQESLKLESALAKLQTAEKIVLLHYAPIAATVSGEATEIYPFVGTTRLEEPIDRHRATLVFHGHAHYGAPEGRTKGQVPVYNVALPLLLRHFPDQPPFRLLNVNAEGPLVHAARVGHAS